MKKKLSQVKENLLPILSYILCSLVHFYCLYIYYSQVNDSDLLHLGYVAYTTMVGNSLIGLTSFVDGESFMDLRNLLDYAQVVLPLPFLTTELWYKHDVGPNEVAILHALFGLSAFLFYVLMEYIRQDLTDFALIVSITSSIVVGLLFKNYLACLAAIVLAGSYFTTKRMDQCASTDANAQMIYNSSSALFSIISLAAFEPNSWIPSF